MQSPPPQPQPQLQPQKQQLYHLTFVINTFLTSIISILWSIWPSMANGGGGGGSGSSFSYSSRYQRSSRTSTSSSSPVLLSLALVGLCVLTSLFPLPPGVNSQRYLLTNKAGCNKASLIGMDKDIARLISLGDKYGRPFPEGKSDVKAYCSETEVLIRRSESFIKKCYRKELADLAGILIYSIKNTIKKFCRKRSKKLTALLSVAPCLNQKLRSDDSCVVNFVEDVRKYIDLRDHTLKIPYSCCAFYESLECVDRSIDSAPCARNYKTPIFEFISGLYSNIADVMCAEYDPSTDRCSRMPKLTGDKFTSIKTAANNTYISFPVALIDLFESV